jgi:hypothetical protein
MFGLGRVTEKQVNKAIKEAKNSDAVDLVGLTPWPDTKHNKDLWRRH